MRIIDKLPRLGEARFVAIRSSGNEKFVERWTGDPTVMIRGPIGVVWGVFALWRKRRRYRQD